MADEVTLIVRRNISAGEELTADYALWEWDESWIAPWTCHCGTALSRQTITGKDWRRPELQERHQGHFSPFLEERIARLR